MYDAVAKPRITEPTGSRPRVMTPPEYFYFPSRLFSQSIINRRTHIYIFICPKNMFELFRDGNLLCNNIKSNISLSKIAWFEDKFRSDIHGYAYG